MDIEFCQTNHECHVCYDEKPGIQFFRMSDCEHKFCHDCMAAFCELHVTDGTVEELRSVVIISNFVNFKGSEKRIFRVYQDFPDFYKGT